jgi:energy-coupling factor transporter transmembrane protein EcfT
VTEPQEEGFVLHWGVVALVALLVVTAGGVLTIGWRSLWVALAVVGGLSLLSFVVTLFEDRWRMVTPVDVARGAPGSCSDCGNELDVLRKARRFTVRWPISRRRGPRAPR